MTILSENLGLEENHIQKAFGGKENGACMRISFYPKCPQPDLTLGLSPHSDPGGITLLFADDHVEGLQVRKDHNWVTVKPIPNAFVVNLGDQMQVYEHYTRANVISLLKNIRSCWGSDTLRLSGLLNIFKCRFKYFLADF